MEVQAKDNGMIANYQGAFARALGVPYGYAFWKGRVALYAILRALEIGLGDEVILPGFTCVVVPNAIRFVGATPVFADITPGTYNLDPDSVEQAITPRTRALIIQHTFGIPADLDPLLEIARRHRLAVIEDCAHALGSTYGGQPVGTYGIAAFFSSQWSKPYTTGLGGIAVTSNPEMAERLHTVQSEFTEPPATHAMRLHLQYAVYRRFFSPQLYWLAVGALHRLSQWNLFVGSSGENELVGAMPADTTWQMCPFQAQVGLEQLQTLSQNSAHRRRLVEIYQRGLQAQGWSLAAIPKQAETVFLRYPIRVANKWELLYKAADARVELGSWFESVLHPIRTSLERFGYQRGRCPVAEQTANEVVNLPLHPRVSIQEAERIVEFICQSALATNH
jgi:dTDP-4-amino-4,6-dideoxygalactose transaminase